jgi:hypothetical protein
MIETPILVVIVLVAIRCNHLVALSLNEGIPTSPTLLPPSALDLRSQQPRQWQRMPSLRL